MTVINPNGAVKKYIDQKVASEAAKRANADSSLQTAVNGKVPTSRKVNGHALTADVTVTKSDVGLGNTDNGAKAPSTDATLASTTNPPTAKVVKDYVDGKFSGDLGTAAYKDVGTAAGNVPVLDANGKLVASTIPELAISRYLGASDTKANLSKITTGQIGDWATVTADPTEANNGAYMLTATTGLTGTWTQISGPTSLVWGKIGGTLSSQTDLQNALNAKQAKLTAGTGLSLTGSTLAIKNVLTAGSIGSATVIPKLTYNAQGQITKAESVTVYPPTSAGTSGQVWRSDGSGAGAWSTPATSFSDVGDSSTLATTWAAFQASRSSFIEAFLEDVSFEKTKSSITVQAVSYGGDIWNPDRYADLGDINTSTYVEPADADLAFLNAEVEIKSVVYTFSDNMLSVTLGYTAASSATVPSLHILTRYLDNLLI